ncbi:NAD(P)/FAD-dependent oxidoreductase [Pseudomonas ogarae]|uniref:N-methyl-L-tryptophan oxidase n=1 Tax=Pseudomonas ogarae (strain DSM 112162 / CECT 30235 / F113) TaxID=1114970 RepID=A0ABN5GF37_PSEO1|nr:FAD-dependent oxidoreductase [Pseudomonas ogarae]AEV65613.1 ForZ [Pseudomonas ogarae]AUO49395.1 N-methyl-L-tryptophan oxidase [Pseudomonas ogarae]
MIYDVIVVGSGAIGGSIAFELATRGLRVCRVGETDRTNAASKAAGAMNGCFGEVTSGLLASGHGRLKLAMDIQAKGMWPQWAQRLAQASGSQQELLTARGTHVILNSAGMAEIDSINYEAIEQTLRDYQEPFSNVSPGGVEWVKANDLVRPLQALLIPDENAVDSHLLLEKLDAALLGSGGEIINKNAHVVLTEGRVATGVMLENGEEIAGSHVVVAAGVQSLAMFDTLDDIKDRIPPMFAGYGVSILVQLKPGQITPSTVIRTPNRAFACGLHCVPRSPELLYLGATNILAEKPRSHALISDVQFLLDCAVDQLNLDLHDAEVVSIQVGNRPIPADGFPLVGQCGYDGLWLATGTYRDGLHQSPLLAAWMADQIQGVPNSLDLSCFAPVRKPLQGLPRSNTVAETVKQMFATGYEYRWNIKPYWMPLLDKGMTENYTALIESLHTQFTPPPELVAFSYLYRSMYDRLARYYEAWS